MALVFIYGSLLPGESNHDVLERGTRMRAAKTATGIGLVIAGPYPSLVFPPHAGAESACVVGELWEVDDEHLAEIDRFEGHPDYFARKTIRLDDGTSAIAYALARDETRDLPLEPSGDYRQRSPAEEKNLGPKPIGA